MQKKIGVVVVLLSKCSFQVPRENVVFVTNEKKEDILYEVRRCSLQVPLARHLFVVQIPFPVKEHGPFIYLP